ncbi:MAG: choice-of-anchor D domain-containing protein [Wenzhouxiangella sp.]|nr:MAG: choice-of-anchor D domain-containing protein [Wenzhouxiangella sp.]
MQTNQAIVGSMIKSFPASFFQSVIVAAVLFLAIHGPNIALAEDEVWVRVHHSGAELRDLAIESELENYGSFHWGRVSVAEYQSLRGQGLSVTATENPFVLTLGGERFDPLDAQALSSKFQTYQADPDGDFHLVQFNGPIRSQWLSDIRASGIVPVQYIHPFTYVVWADDSGLIAGRNVGSVRWVGDFLPEFRVNPDQRVWLDDEEPVILVASNHADSDRLVQRLQERGTEIIEVSPYTANLKLIKALAPGPRFLELGQVPGVYTVQRAMRMRTRGEMSNQAIVNNHGDAPNFTIVPGYADWLSDTGFDGSGVIVSIMDSGVRATHVDLVDRMLPCTPSASPTTCASPSSAHGTHVAGAVAGTGATGAQIGGFLRGQGVAPGANLISQVPPGLNQWWGQACSGIDPSEGEFCLTPNGMLRLFKEAATNGAVLANNSWGSPGFHYGYDIITQQVDVLVRNSDPDSPTPVPVLPLWSIQNGSGDRPNGSQCDPASLGSPEEAKNVFAIGASRLQNSNGSQVGGSQIFSVGQNSAHGPACDGRTNPDIVAPGWLTDSTSSASNTAHAFNGGTSMASPVVSGASAIFVQYFREAFDGVTPSPAMVKAAFTAVAINMQGQLNANGGTITETPSRFQGWGRLDLDAVVNPTQQVLYFDQEHVFTETGQSWSIPVVADDGDEPMRLMLMWTDAHGHGLAGTTPAWVNLLDLSVDSASGTYLGNQIGSDGFSTTGGVPDDRNNMEGIFLRPDQHGGQTLIVNVAAAQVVADALNPWNADPENPTQDFALVCYNCVISEGGFELALNPFEASICIPDDDSVSILADVSVEAPAGYTGTVDLSADGLPAGVTSSFDPASVEGAGQSEWTLTVDAAAEAGSSSLLVIGDDGDEIQQQPFALTLLSLPDAPLLIAPGDGDTDVGLQPELLWDSLAGVDDYRLQVATDVGFADLVVDTMFGSTSFNFEEKLMDGSTYFWRVLGQDQCGDGQWSEVFQFQTRFEPQAVVSPAALQAEIITSQSASLSLTIANSGSGQLDWEIANVVCGDGEAIHWLSVEPASGSSTVGDMDEVTVTIDAADLPPGAYAGGLCITTNVFEGAPVSVEVTVDVLDLPPAVVEIEVSALEFGSVPTNLSPSRNFEIRNVAVGIAADLSIDTIAVIAGGSVFEVVGHDCPSSLPAGQVCTVEVRFAPDSARAYSGVLRITTDGESRNIVLSGIGVEPDPIIFRDGFEDGR